MEKKQNKKYKFLLLSLLTLFVSHRGLYGMDSGNNSEIDSELSVPAGNKDGGINSVMGEEVQKSNAEFVKVKTFEDLNNLPQEEKENFMITKFSKSEFGKKMIQDNKTIQIMANTIEKQRKTVNCKNKRIGSKNKEIDDKDDELYSKKKLMGLQDAMIKSINPYEYNLATAGSMAVLTKTFSRWQGTPKALKESAAFQYLDRSTQDVFTGAFILYRDYNQEKLFTKGLSSGKRYEPVRYWSVEMAKSLGLRLILDRYVKDTRLGKYYDRKVPAIIKDFSSNILLPLSIAILLPSSKKTIYLIS